MLFAFLIAICWAHSFDVNFYGHDIFCRLEEQKIIVSYTIEVPREHLGKDIRSFSPNGSVSKENLRDAFVAQYYETIQSEIDLLIDGEHHPWSSVNAEAFRATDKGQFGAFTVHMTAVIPQDSSSLAIINSNAMGERSIFRNRVVVDSSLFVYDSDLLELKGDSVLVSWNGKWNIREELREIRISYSVVGELWRAIDHFWNSWLYQREKSSPIEQAVWQGWIQEWKNGRTSLAHFGLAIGIGMLVCGIRIRRSFWLVLTLISLLIAISSAGDVPWSWLSSISLLGMVILLVTAPSSWPLFFVFFASIWMKPAALGIPLVLLLWLCSNRGVQSPKWLSRGVLFAGCIVTLILHLYYII